MARRRASNWAAAGAVSVLGLAIAVSGSAVASALIAQNVSEEIDVPEISTVDQKPRDSVVDIADTVSGDGATPSESAIDDPVVGSAPESTDSEVEDDASQPTDESNSDDEIETAGNDDREDKNKKQKDATPVEPAAPSAPADDNSDDDSDDDD